MRVPAHRDWLYAVGDVNGRALLTQAAKYQALVACATIMNREAHAVWDGELTPQVVFTEPQVASVGLTLARALSRACRRAPSTPTPERRPGASFIGKGAPSGARIVVDEVREVIVGATLVGPDIAESLQAATFAIVGEIPLRRLVHAMPPFPDPQRGVAQAAGRLGAVASRSGVRRPLGGPDSKRRASKGDELSWRLLEWRAADRTRGRSGPATAE